jgi:Protein of unknown function (DUF2934)
MARRSTAIPAPAQPDFGSLVAERAYYKAEGRGFKPGQELEDWLAAEREVAELLAASDPMPAAQPAKKAIRRNSGATTTTKRA